ncbi:Kinesin-like protein KIN-14Q [Phytophthora citrophthora]|uniref:Kinesin-like protein KIN-14Q n=1 Tax=Phytophthora citrophthora TaxID=4793 RepID=A0AAD9LEZ7_9STRA|nr:Kinesin-like protein KIN-14Q [Phytophthora citrophthora]
MHRLDGPNEEEDLLTVLEEDQQELRSDDDGGEDGSDVIDTVGSSPSTTEPESLASLLVNMTEKVQEERCKRGEVEKRNHSLLMELDQLQQVVLALRAAAAESERKVSSECTASSSSLRDQLAPSMLGDAEAGEFCWKELLDAKKAKEKALAEAHQRAMQVMELNACISMQHDELVALRTRAREDLEALEQSETSAKELRQERQLLTQETKLLRDNVEHLTEEMGKRGTHFKAIMEKWTEAQAQSEHRERENAALRDQLQAARQRAELRERELETLRDERDALQHQANQLKGAVAAKTAESKAFQAYGASAREHLQSQQAAIQRHSVYRRQVNSLARDAITSLRGMRATLAQTRAPLVAVQGDFRRFLERLRVPVMTLVERSSRYAQAAHIEHAPLRLALYSAELARRHLHEQLWRSKRDALIICQLQNVEPSPNSVVGDESTSETLVLRANYSNGELFLREAATNADDSQEVLGVKCDAVFSDRAREWDRHESVTPLLQSVLDGCNACVTTFVGAPPLRIGGSTAQQTVSELVLRELFATVAANGDSRFHRAKFTISFLAVFNETVYDLLGLEAMTAPSTEVKSSTARQIVVLEVQNAEEALMVLTGGREYLTTSSTQQFGVLDAVPSLTASLTHTVATVCLSYENLLAGSASVKSKLQIVELALGSGSSVKAAVKPTLPWSDNREEVRQRVAVENGAEALVTALAEVRLKDVAFVRYHSSKLTVLLQDTVKPGAKFLALVGLPSSCPVRAASSKDVNAAAIVRVLQQMRTAMGGGEDSRMNNRDRSLEGFMNRLALQQCQPSNDVALPFSSLDMQDHSRHRAESVTTWGTELEILSKRYGRAGLDVLDVAPPSPRHNETQDYEQPQQHQQVPVPAAVHPIIYANSSESEPPPAPIASVRKSKPSRKGSKSLKTNRGPSPVSTKKQAATIHRAGRSVPVPLNTTTTTSSLSAPLSTIGTVLKIRRETASSALKKTLVNRRLQDARSPFR